MFFLDLQVQSKAILFFWQKICYIQYRPQVIYKCSGFPPSLKAFHQQSKMMGFHKICLCLTVRFLVIGMSQESFGAKFSMDPVSIL